MSTLNQVFYVPGSCHSSLIVCLASEFPCQYDRLGDPENQCPHFGQEWHCFPEGRSGNYLDQYWGPSPELHEHRLQVVVAPGYSDHRVRAPIFLPSLNQRHRQCNCMSAVRRCLERLS
jgi:hypothetical protein